MNYDICIRNAKSIDELPGAWTKEDLVNLLAEFEIEETTDSSENDLRDLLYMAISDKDPDESAQIILSYVLGDQLSEGQIDQLSHEMQEDPVFEEYADISLHKELFRINQLLYKAYNGTFPRGKATIIQLEIKAHGHTPLDLSEQTLVQAICSCCSERNIITRLFEKQLSGKVEFPEADSIIWQVERVDELTYKLITSDYWISPEDLIISKQVVRIQEFVDAVDE